MLIKIILKRHYKVKTYNWSVKKIHKKIFV